MKRHEMIGIKQSVRLEWLQKSCDLVREGWNEKEIRAELREYLSERMGRGAIEKRSETACNFSISMLMKIWVSPDEELLPLRDAGLDLLEKATDDEKTAIHFCMLSAAYPFWYNVSKQIGLLLRLQERVTVQQIIQRTKEYYGDRQTVDRNTRFVIRSLYYWNLLSETDSPGCYKKGMVADILPDSLNAWILEAQLHSLPNGKAILSKLQSDMSLFSFNTKTLNGTIIRKNNDRVEVLQSGLSDEIIMIR
jgi:hypothetical protein